jgi:uncharacterized protein
MLKKIIAAVATLMLLAVAPAFSEDAKLTRTISISGHGEVSAVPDHAVINIGVISSAPTAREALDANTKAMSELMALLKKAGIEAKDLQTSNFSVGPRYSYDNNNSGQPPKIVGYDVNNMLMVNVRKVAELGELLDVAVSSGSNLINGITFSVAKPEAMLDEARKIAVADARRKAEIYASAGGFALGEVLTVTEGTAVGPQPPVFYGRAAKAEAADVPIAQGEQSLSVDVNITYAIK